MKQFRRLMLAIMIGTGLSACVNEPQQYSDVHTGVTAGVSKRYSVYENLLVSVFGQAFVATKGGEVRQGIYVNQIATGMGWSFFHSAYSFGVQLPYERGSSNVMGCGGGCTLQEEGAILLSGEQFRSAAKTGMEIKLVGSGNSVIIRIPPAAFQEALAMRPGQ
ncbi:hypothetical protein [Tabrizicola sp.]|uniref:hypothetical protein n=1 Tax=Tabrizicola sp. TaxID=2005166 RepID=UPI003F337EBB